MATIKRRRPEGTKGGRPVGRRFWFAPADGDKYPSESAIIRTDRIESTDMTFDSWAWALEQMKDAHEPQWLVIPIDQHDEKRDRNVARSSVWRTAKRHGLSIATEYVAPNLYVAISE